jgi:Cyclin
MVYYIDSLCALYPAFAISSLTVHRFLITAATVASKGLSDSFWTNSTYAHIGGVSLRELALLELEFLWRVHWRIVPKPEVLVDYYRSLVERCDGYEIAADSDAMVTADGIPEPSQPLLPPPKEEEQQMDKDGVSVAPVAK